MFGLSWPITVLIIVAIIVVVCILIRCGAGRALGNIIEAIFDCIDGQKRAFLIKKAL